MDNKKRREYNQVTIELCRSTMKEIDNKELQNIKKCLLTLCDIIENYQDDGFSVSLTSILEIIVYHMTHDPSREKLILKCLENFDEMLVAIHESKTSSDELLNKMLSGSLSLKNKTKNESLNPDGSVQLNLFNADGSRCTMEELSNSWWGNLLYILIIERESYKMIYYDSVES